MRWFGNICGEKRTIKRFALLPIKANGECRWFEFVWIHQTWLDGSWHNDWFEN